MHLGWAAQAPRLSMGTVIAYTWKLVCVTRGSVAGTEETTSKSSSGPAFGEGQACASGMHSGASTVGASAVML